MNIDHFGKTTSGKGKGEAKGKSKTVDAEPDRGGFKGKCCWCNKTAHTASECRKKRSYLKGKGKSNIHQVDEEEPEHQPCDDGAWGPSRCARWRKSRSTTRTWSGRTLSEHQWPDLPPTERYPPAEGDPWRTLWEVLVRQWRRPHRLLGGHDPLAQSVTWASTKSSERLVAEWCWSWRQPSHRNQSLFGWRLHQPDPDNATLAWIAESGLLCPHANTLTILCYTSQKRITTILRHHWQPKGARRRDGTVGWIDGKHLRIPQTNKQLGCYRMFLLCIIWIGQSQIRVCSRSECKGPITVDIMSVSQWVRYSIADRSLQGCQQPEADKRAFSASQHQMIEPRLAPYKIQRRHHIDARYYFDLAFAQDRGLMIYQTQCTAIVLYNSVPADTLVRVVKIYNSEGCNDSEERIPPDV